MNECSVRTLETKSGVNMKSDCEEISRYDWTWDTTNKSQTVLLVQFNTQIIFHPTYSSGTGAVFGNCPLTSPYHHYWEVDMLSPVYGTDVMVGLATKSVNITNHSHTFASLVGHDQHSWGFSYQGTIHHNGNILDYGPKWGKGDTVGLHLDTWRGTVEFYLNKKPLGVAFRDLCVREDIFPLVSSTAAKSEMKLVTAQSYKNSLQFSCLKVLSNKLPGSNLMSLYLPPGLKNFIQNNFWFFVNLETEKEKGLIIATDTPTINRPGFPCSFIDDRFVMTINSSRKRQLGEVLDSSETEDNDSFHVRPKRFRKAKLALMRKCKRERQRMSDESSSSSPVCFSQDLTLGKCQETKVSKGNPSEEVVVKDTETEETKSTQQRKKRFKLRKQK